MKHIMTLNHYAVIRISPEAEPCTVEQYVGIVVQHQPVLLNMDERKTGGEMAAIS